METAKGGMHPPTPFGPLILFRSVLHGKCQTTACPRKTMRVGKGEEDQGSKPGAETAVNANNAQNSSAMAANQSRPTRIASRRFSQGGAAGSFKASTVDWRGRAEPNILKGERKPSTHASSRSPEPQESLVDLGLPEIQEPSHLLTLAAWNGCKRCMNP